MPTYDYRCESCEHAFELYQSITAKPIRKCPSCGERKVVRLMGTGGGIIFKGSGFYQTDYRSEQYKQAAKSDGPSKDGSAKKDTGGSSTPSTTGDSTSSTPAKKNTKND